MKLRVVSWIVALLAAMGAADPVDAQRPGAGAAVDSAMAPLAWLIGEWEGTGTTRSRTGSEVASVREKVESKLGGRVLIMEGIGRVPTADGTGRVVHHAFGVLSYDPEKREYVLRAFRDGGAIDPVSRLADGAFIWEFDIPGGGGRTRYVIRNDGGEWLETGEYSLDGSTWRKFFEMRLHRAAGAP